MRPHHDAQADDADDAENGGVEVVQRLPGEHRCEFHQRDDGGHQNHVHLRVPEQPEQVLIQPRTAPAGGVIELAGDGPVDRKENLR
jgi:hypothetical protein